MSPYLGTSPNVFTAAFLHGIALLPACLDNVHLASLNMQESKWAQQALWIWMYPDSALDLDSNRQFDPKDALN